MQKDNIEKWEPGITRVKYGGAYTDDADFEAINSVLERNWWTIDEHGRELEKELAEFTKCKHAVLTNSGSSALMVAYAALNLPLGSEIITSPVQFPTAISAMFYNHLTPVYVDSAPGSMVLDPDLIEQAISEKTKAILVVTAGGQIPNLLPILAIAKKYGLKTILDNCDGFGGTWEGKPLESHFDISATSFHAAHIMSMGEGGAVFTNDDFYGERAKSMREWGRIGDTDNNTEYPEIPEDYPGRYIFKYMGFNVKPLELQCAMGRTQLKKLPEIKRKRMDNWMTLARELSDLDFSEDIEIVTSHLQANPSWFCFPMFSSKRAELREYLESYNIETRTIFGGNITRQPAFKNFGRIATPLPNADRVMTEGMFVGVNPHYGSHVMEFVAEKIQEFYE